MFHPVHNKRLHRQVFEQIQKLILSGKVKPGDKLPSERELGEMLKVSRNSIREALRSLEILGIIECRQGGGNYIKLDISSGLIEPLSIMFQLHGGSIMDILEARRAMESEAAALAAKRHSPRQASELKTIMEKTKTAKSEAENIRLDKEFHLRIAEYSGNVLLLSFLTAISSLLERSIKDGRRAILKSFDNHSSLIKAHERICKAILARKPAAAARAIDSHFKMIIDNLPKR